MDPVSIDGWHGWTPPKKNEHIQLLPQFDLNSCEIGKVKQNEHVQFLLLTNALKICIGKFEKKLATAFYVNIGQSLQRIGWGFVCFLENFAACI
jgi:hypothetical protein